MGQIADVAMRTQTSDETLQVDLGGGGGGEGGGASTYICIYIYVYIYILGLRVWGVYAQP